MTVSHNFCLHHRPRVIACGAVVALAVTLGACGGGSKTVTVSPTPASSTASSATTPAATSTSGQNQATRAQLNSAAAVYNRAFTAFKARAKVDSAANDIQALKSDIAQFRTGIADYDAAVRQIAFPAALATKRNDLLGASGTAIADLDAAAGATTVTEYNRLITRFNQDNATLVQANNSLDTALAQG